VLSEAQISELHSLYERLSGNVVTLTLGRMAAWQLWAAQIGGQIRRLEQPGLTVRIALDEIINHRRRMYGDKPHTLASVLKFRHIVEQPDYAEEDLSDAIRRRRQIRSQTPAQPDKVRVLAATGRPTTLDAAPKTSPEVAARLLQQLKDAAK
jgi:hypothetical protein